MYGSFLTCTRPFLNCHSVFARFVHSLLPGGQKQETGGWSKFFIFEYLDKIGELSIHLFSYPFIFIHLHSPSFIFIHLFQKLDSETVQQNMNEDEWMWTDVNEDENHFGPNFFSAIDQLTILIRPCHSKGQFYAHHFWYFFIILHQFLWNLCTSPDIFFRLKVCYKLSNKSTCR